jgi:HSP20 family molecular chaperone IbpA
MFGKKKNNNNNKDSNSKDNGNNFNDPFAELFERMIKEQEELLRSMFGDFPSASNSVVTKVTVGPDGKPKVEKFVNGVPVEEETQNDIEPELVESGDKVIVTMELPNMKKENISVKLKNKTKLIVMTEDGLRKEVQLPGPVSPLSARYKNGVLSCTFHKDYQDSEENIVVE